MIDRNDSEFAISRAIVAAEDELHSDLIETGKRLQQQAYDLIFAAYKESKMTPPAVLVSRSESRKIGPKLVWVTFTKRKNNRLGRDPIRFTREISGRRKLRYPRSAFLIFDSTILPQIYEIEAAASELRNRVSHWRMVIGAAKRILEEADS